MYPTTTWSLATKRTLNQLQIRNHIPASTGTHVLDIALQIYFHAQKIHEFEITRKLISYMLASENAMNLTQWLTSDIQLGDDGKTPVTHLETFWWQYFKTRHNRCLSYVTIADLPTVNNKGAGTDWGGGSSILCV